MKAFVPHFDAGVDGADEEDIGEDDEDADVKTKHKCCSAEEKETRLIRMYNSHYVLIN